MMEEFYQPYRDAHNPLYNNDCLYTPEVIVFKSDVALPERMDEGDFYKVDVLTCAAPNLRAVPSNEMNPSAGTKAANIDEESLYKLHTKRIERIFQAAISNRAEVLILGAFGCGAFCIRLSWLRRLLRQFRTSMQDILIPLNMLFFVEVMKPKIMMLFVK